MRKRSVFPILGLIAITASPFLSPVLGQTFEKIRTKFSIFETHGVFYNRYVDKNRNLVSINNEYYGKRYAGTGTNNTLPYLKVWSSFMASNPSRRQIIYQEYDGYDDKPSGINEWEEWGLNSHRQTVVYRYGGTQPNRIGSSQPYEHSWMNQMKDTLTSPKSLTTPHQPTWYYQCLGITERDLANNSATKFKISNGMIYPDMQQGQSYTVSFGVGSKDPIPNASQYRCSAKNDNNHYIAIKLRDDFGLANSPERIAKCDQYVPSIFARDGSANKICKVSPNVGRFDQRYAWQSAGNKWGMGCEALIYVYGYPADPENKFQKYLRNGELRWQGYSNVENTTGVYIAPDKDSWWNSRCDQVWNEKPGYIYTGEFQYGLDLFHDKLDSWGAATLVSLPKTNPNPHQVTWQANREFKGACGADQENWCAIGQTCDTGWVSGPAVKVKCPPNERLINTGLIQTRSDLTWSFSGKSECKLDPYCH